MGILKVIKDEKLHLHYFISLSLTFVIGYLFGNIAAVIVVLIIGIAKELFDKYIRKNKFSILDLIADIAGILTGLLALSGIDKLLGD